jgi:hypothetical protein
MAGESVLVIIAASVIAGGRRGWSGKAPAPESGDSDLDVAGAFVGMRAALQLLVPAIVNATIGANFLVLVIAILRGGSRRRRA